MSLDGSTGSYWRQRESTGTGVVPSRLQTHSNVMKACNDFATR